MNALRRKEPSAPGDAVNRYVVSLCDDCLRGAGGECHTPGCALWMNRAPDVPVRVEGPACAACVADADLTGGVRRKGPHG